MEPFVLSGYLGLFTCIGFGCLVLFKSEDKNLARVWFLFNLSAAIWCLGVILFPSTQDPQRAIILFRLSFAIGVTWIAILFLHFSYLLIGKTNNFFLKSNYIIGLLFTPLIFTSYFTSTTKFVFGRFYYPQAGPLLSLYALWWFGLIIYAHYITFRHIKNCSPTKQNQIRYFLLATLIGFSGGSMGYIPIFDLDIYPWGSFCISLYPILMSYAILRYQLMDIRLFIRRTALLGSIYIVLLLLTAPLINLMFDQVLKNGPDSKVSMFAGTIFIGFIISTGPLMFAFLSRRASYFKENTIAGITHELKSPLSSIQSAIELIDEECSKGSRKEKDISSYIEMVKSNSNRLELFIQDLLHVAQIQNSDFSLNKEPTDLNQLISSLVDRYQPKAKLKNLTLSFDQKERISLIADKNKITQTISNLLSNAIKYSNHGEIKIHLTKKPKNVLISVTDQGEGIPQNQLTQIFKRFHQIKPNQKGTGLGLTIAKAWVEAHGGKIWAKSEGEGKGTSFLFTIPEN